MNPDESASDPRTKATLRVSGITRDAFMNAALAERLDADSFTDALAIVVASIAGVIVVGQDTPREQWNPLILEVIKNTALTAGRIVLGPIEKAPDNEP
jgi:hypothetical protein